MHLTDSRSWYGHSFIRSVAVGRRLLGRMHFSLPPFPSAPPLEIDHWLLEYSNKLFTEVEPSNATAWHGMAFTKY